jgi:hypothetical protein
LFQQAHINMAVTVKDRASKQTPYRIHAADCFIILSIEKGAKHLCQQ